MNVWSYFKRKSQSWQNIFPFSIQSNSSRTCTSTKPYATSFNKGVMKSSQKTLASWICMKWMPHESFFLLLHSSFRIPGCWYLSDVAIGAHGISMQQWEEAQFQVIIDQLLVRMLSVSFYIGNLPWKGIEGWG